MHTYPDFGVDIEQDERDASYDKLRLFVSGHEKMLLEIQQTFDTRWDPTMWDPHTDTVSVKLGAQGNEDNTSLADILGRSHIQNRIFYRITLCFASLVGEMDSLTAEAFEIVIPPLAMFGDSPSFDEGITDEEAQKGAGRMLSFLQSVWAWIQRVMKVVLHTVRQLASLYSLRKKDDKYFFFTQVRLPRVWRSLTDLIGALVNVEEVLQTHEKLHYGLSVYRKLMTQVSRNSEKFEYSEKTMEIFCKLLNKIDCEVLDDGILQRLVMQSYDFENKKEGEMVLVSTNSRFQMEFSDFLGQIISSVEISVETPCEGDARRRYIGILGMYYLYFHLFSQIGRSAARSDIFKQVFLLHRKIPVIYIQGVHIFSPIAWLLRRLPVELNRLLSDPIKEETSLVRQACEKSASLYLSQLNRLATLVSTWLAEINSNCFGQLTKDITFLQTTTLLLQRGVLLAQHVQRVLINHIALHKYADMPITLQHADGFAQGLQLLMMIRSAYHAKTGVTATTYNYVVRSITYVIERHLYKVYLALGNLAQDGKEEVVNQYNAVGEAIALLHKPQTPENMVCLDIVLNIAFNQRSMNKNSLAVISPNHINSILAAFSQLRGITSHQTALQAATDCDFIYWHREAVYPLFFDRIYQKPLKSNHLPYLIMAMHDCCPSIISSKHVKNAVSLLNDYKTYIRSCLQKLLIGPLCTDIEDELRLHTHSVVLGQPFRHTEAVTGARDMGRFTRLPPFKFFNEWLHIATEVENYLDAQFYNLNAIMLNDWKMYEEMRNLALVRYGIHICDGYLPGSIVDQGLDVLVITENIQAFVSNYTYNMNEQLFVQRPSTTESKHLHILHIRHIANSIRTHGTGIMNTTVNYVYKYLLKKLSILSQFLYDDHVKSRLIKDAKLFHTQKDELKGEYPLSRAEKFIREMRKLGVADDGQTFLDKFCHLVSEIGNALGYMRMMRSGGLRAIADAAVFIPSIDKTFRLERVIDPDAIGSDDGEETVADVLAKNDVIIEKEKEKAPPCTVEAVRVVDRVIHDMRRKLSDGSEYFGMLLEAVMKRLKDTEKYSHLKNFYMIIPPICVLHVELMIREKEQLLKKNKDGIFTDDGFALGCSFLLKLFGVSELFESLHWFDSVRKHYAMRLSVMQKCITEREKEEKKQKNHHKKDYSYEDEEINNMHLTATMVDYAINEYAAVEEAFVSSKVFFHFTIPEEGDDEEEN